MAIYVVQQGDHLSSIAERFGFRDYRNIWNDSGNAELRALRKDPHVLLPGDSLVIPDKQVKTVKKPTGAQHRFVVGSSRLMLRIILRDFDHEPIANVDCELEIEGTIVKLQSNGQGLIEKMIEKGARRGMLRVPALDLEHPIHIGDLDPVEGDEGWRARLINLGYYPGTVNDLDEQPLRHAIEEFQCDYDLKVSGELDVTTQAALIKAHGV